MKKHFIILIAIILVASFLRLYKLDQVAPSLFGDELDVGYHAYSILKTGKDYSGNSWPLHFQSLAEYRTPLYLYSVVPTVAIFGISAWGVRLPAAIFGILSIWAIYLLAKRLTKKESIGLLAAAVLAVSPWHIQYSRAAFEVTQMLFFLILGLYFFLTSLEQKGKNLWMAAVCFALMPWIYSTAKVFTPMLLVFLFLFYFRQIFKLPRKSLLVAILALAIVGLPIAYSTVFGGGADRFGYIGVFSDPTTETEIGTARQIDARARGEMGEGLHPTIVDKLFHNKFTFWGDNIFNNYYQSLSSDFLFNRGDPNLRHSIEGMGELYKVEVIPLILGVIMFFAFFKDLPAQTGRKAKLLIAFWLLAGITPASLTRDGGNHATRLILTLPPLMFLVAYGLYSFSKIKPKYLFYGVLGIYSVLFLVNFSFYQHNYWVHNPWYSERWWHSGWQQAIQSVKDNEANFDKVVITSADEPPWIFFAAWYQYDPAKWHQGYPLKTVELKSFGEVSYIDKYYFGSPSSEYGLYEWGQALDTDTLYMASAKEVKINLIQEPDRTPSDLNLIKSIAYPSGEPAFYLFSKK